MSKEIVIEMNSSIEDAKKDTIQEETIQEDTKVGKVEIKVLETDLVGYWEWDLKINECIICKTDLQDPNVDKIEVGNCGHAFHCFCIGEWIKHKNSCPFCNIPWNPNKDFETDYNIYNISSK